MKTKFTKTRKIIFAFALVNVFGIFTSCKFFENPQGTVEVVSTRITKQNSTSYCDVDVKITNTSDHNIYLANYTVEVLTNKNSYVENSLYSYLITPGNSVYSTVSFSFLIVEEEDSEENEESGESENSEETNESESSTEDESNENESSENDESEESKSEEDEYNETEDEESVKTEEWDSESARIISYFFN